MAARPSRSLITALVLAPVTVALVWFVSNRVHFDWHALGRELRSVSPWYVLTGGAIIYGSYWLRSLRWAVLVSPVRPTTAKHLFGPTLVGFTAIVLLGRLADLVRPYLIAKRLRLPVASQFAVYSLERAFDLGAAAILFSFTLAIAPRDIPHHAAYVRAGAISLAATVGIAIFALSLRAAGETIARYTRRTLRPLSETFAENVADRLIDFRDGLRTIQSVREFLKASAVSILMWVGIAIAYVLAAHSFTSVPTLAHLGFTATMLLLATSLGGSLIQLPILGWFTQIALIGTAIHAFFGVPVETATACSAVIFFVLNLDVVPAGFIAARMEGTSLRTAMQQSKAAAPAETR